MSREAANFEQKLTKLMDQADGLMQELISLRRKDPALRAETAKILENQLIAFSRRIKQLSRENNDDLTAGISFLKIKMLG